MAKFIITVKSAFSLNLPCGEKKDFAAGTFETDDETIGKHWYVKANSVVIENKPAKDKPASKDEGQNLDGQVPTDLPEGGSSADEANDDQQGDGQETEIVGQSEGETESEGLPQDNVTPKTEPGKPKASRGRPKK